LQVRLPKRRKRGKSKMPDMILNIINEYVASVKKIFGTYLRKVIVYGSYARGDYNEKSDIDIMFIVTLNENEIHEKFNDVCDIAFEYEMKYGIVISPIIKNNQHFEKWVGVLPFYQNVIREGVCIYE
jgi:predicted nucleotidyltransferase